ncbi:basic leucine zipper 23 [Elaeis guineensis]|uniref:Basic leucine zipper 23 n=1 Tax=Elaeis guineensis var. tenera TaxID=51953 RepID=A0A6I9RSV9_ELAGV|nr:basic leucine zipper 23 [Elaeis guineensis]
MDDGGVDLSSLLLLPNPEMSNTFDEFFRKTRTCTHTHTCNPPGPAAATHTHTCYHTHTQMFATAEEEREGEKEQKKPRKPFGNREAVRKYREKKKAHVAYLEEEVKKLRLVNQQLLRRLQGQAALEAEVVRLRSLLVDLRAKIDAELGTFPFQKQCSGAGLRCNNPAQCFGGNGEVVSWEGSCGPAVVDYKTNLDGDIEKNLEIAKAVNSFDVMGGFMSSASQAE